MLFTSAHINSATWESLHCYNRMSIPAMHKLFFIIMGPRGPKRRERKWKITQNGVKAILKRKNRQWKVCEKTQVCDDNKRPIFRQNIHYLC